MVRQSDQEQLRAEEAELCHLLEELPEENAIDRMSLEVRLEDVREQLEKRAGEQAAMEPARARLTFQGEPVVGPEGILFDFGAVALQKFEQMVATVGAYLRTGELGATGLLPAREEHRLMITGTAVGSFGFALEEEELALLRGKITPAVENPDELGGFMKQRVTMRVRKTTLGGGKLRFALLALPSLADQSS